METAKYVLENEIGTRFDLTAPGSIYMVNVEGLGAESDNGFADLDAGFFQPIRDGRPQSSITGDLIYQIGAYSNYPTLVNFILGAKKLYFCYQPTDTEYRRQVRLRSIQKSRRDSAGWMRGAISFDPLTPWYRPVPAELEITVRTGQRKAYLATGTPSVEDDYFYSYVTEEDDPSEDDYFYSYGGEAVGDMSVQFTPAGHEAAAILLQYTGEIVNPAVRLVGSDTGKVYGICDVEAELGASDTFVLCTQYEGSYVIKIASGDAETNLLDAVNLAYDPYVRLPVDEPSVLTLESDDALTGTAELTVFYYYRSV